MKSSDKKYPISYTWTYDNLTKLYVLKLSVGYTISSDTLKGAMNLLDNLAKNNYFAVFSKE